MYLSSLVTILSLSGLVCPAAFTPDTLSTAQRDEPEFIYKEAYRLRIAKNGDYGSYYDTAYDRILPGVPDSNSQKTTWWFGYKRTSTRFRNIAVATQKVGPIFYEQEFRTSPSSSTWKAYTDNERWFRLSWDGQNYNEFDPDYPKDHNLFITTEGDYALGAPAPTHPPSVWGNGVGTWLVCQRKFQREDVLAVRFAYTWPVNETTVEYIDEDCVPVMIESRCAELQPLVHNKTWNHDKIILTPCVLDEFPIEDEISLKRKGM
ncbi:hypothetical protein SUNI508_05358 [Seiridium unicorne]|uniref:Uncharacterized protein n=1 Tax=Seiridium unicorne TaxID=138068 RepID=A0ABR2V4B0_9PEZI